MGNLKDQSFVVEWKEDGGYLERKIKESHWEKSGDQMSHYVLESVLFKL